MFILLVWWAELWLSTFTRVVLSVNTARENGLRAGYGLRNGKDLLLFSEIEYTVLEFLWGMEVTEVELPELTFSDNHRRETSKQAQGGVGEKTRLCGTMFLDLRVATLGG